MIACAVTGFKDSGKTTHTAALARELGRLGKRVGVIKRTEHGLDRSGADTATLLEAAHAVAGQGPGAAALFWNAEKDLHTLAALMEVDVLLVEGGKSLGFLPRLLVLRDPEEARDLAPDLALGVLGDAPAPDDLELTSLDHAAAANTVLERGFLLPGLDCGACGREDCRGLAVDMAAGRAAFADCVAANAEGLSVTVNGQPLGMNPFVARFFRAGVLGMLGELKGFSKGSIKIEMDS